ncbi:hypothetical protein FIBSPDRAFT_963501 [Athelia psychrophila]|uniref:Uncharacterized protein n=1 Tax=Athelia psychrophila TaxID=1759441 RepID=A0A165YXR3_9AGAM|nr:hypothetical protein FIBSPDRAFT_963501 [Fibularhizoctonia sp. CBS 109695]
MEGLMETLNQCSECGLCGTTLTSPCGTCKRKVHEENGTLDATSLSAQNQRRHQINSRLTRGGLAVAPGLATPFKELVNLRANNAGSSNFFTVFVEVRRSSAPASVDKILGKTCVPRSESTTFLALRAMLVEELNPKWTRNHTYDLRVDEVEIRARGNITLAGDVDFDTLRKFIFNPPLV